MSDNSARLVSKRRDLPARASLEHLRNEAKAHLCALRQEKPATRLSEAQLDVARRYGFSSWRALKTYVDALHGFGPQIIDAVQGGDLLTIRKILDRWRKPLRKTGKDPFGDLPSEDISKKALDDMLVGDDTEASAVVHSARRRCGWSDCHRSSREVRRGEL